MLFDVIEPSWNGYPFLCDMGPDHWCMEKDEVTYIDG